MRFSVYEPAPGRVLFSQRTHVLGDQQLYDLLKVKGITAVVNLWHTKDERVTSLGIRYGHFSMPDGRISDATLAIAKKAAACVSLWVRLGECVLVHCWGGKNRACLVSAIALMNLECINGSESICMVKRARAGALSNKHFLSWLESQSKEIV